MRFRDVGVRLVHGESAGTSLQFLDTLYDVQGDREGESNALDHDRHEGGSADKSDKR